MWLPQWDWRWYKAELYQESALNTDAVSPVGARGLCQAMPGTWAQISQALHWGVVSPSVARYCITGGAYYLAQMRAVWTADRAEAERRRLAQASYNAGAGSIVAAQRECYAAIQPNCRDWEPISGYLIDVTGAANARQTLDYVDRIQRWYLLLNSGG